jgi:transposase
MESLILILAQNMTIKAVADLIDENDTRIWRVVHHYVEDARSNEDYSKVTTVGVDETSLSKGHNYISVFVDFDNSKVIYACEGRDSETIGAFKSDLESHKGCKQNIKNFCCDMSPAFISGIKNNFPDASLTFDKFHIMKMMNEAVDKVRREEQAHNISLKHTRYIWLKNPERLTDNQKATMCSLKDMRLKTVNSYNIKLSLRDFWNFKDPALAEDYLKKWYFWATHSRLKPVIDVAKTLKAHWTGTVNYIKTRIDNGILEGLNSLIQSAKSSARGFRSSSNLITIIYLRLGKLKFNLPT